MNNRKIIEGIGKELSKKVDLTYKKNSQKFFKEKIQNLGVRIPEVRKISKKYYEERVKNWSKKAIWEICEKLLTKEDEFKFIALDWAFRQKNSLTPQDFQIFESWLEKYIKNWATCDDFCGHALGYLLYRFPELSLKTKKWAYSENYWLRRASAVVFIYSLRKDKLLKEAFEIADILLQDKEDLVQKAYGWMLKEASNLREKEIFEYVIKNKNQMPRTALRYAIEKMPPKLKKQAMLK